MTLREAGVTLIDCDHRTPPETAAGYPYITIPHLRDGRVEFAGARRISREHFLDWTRKAKPATHDLVLSRRCNPGESAFVGRDREFALGQNLVLLRADGSHVDPRFLRWLARGPEWWEQVGKFLNAGAVFDSLRCADIPEFRLTIPPLPEQRAIAQILGTLDDKIELNRRMHETLGAMARALFKSWFVDFDPVRARAEGRHPGVPQPFADLLPDALEDSELGTIPKSWSVTSLEALFPDDEECVLTGPFGSTLHAHDYREDGVPLILVKHVVEGRIADEGLPLVGAHKVDELGRYRVRLGDIVFTRVGAVGRAAYVHAENVGWLISGQLLRVRVPDWRRLHPRYLSQLFLEQTFTDMVEGHALGTTRPSLNTALLRNFRFVAPPGEVAQYFADLVHPLDAAAQARRRESCTLAAVRDTLLPKLLSGELRVAAMLSTLEDAL